MTIKIVDVFCTMTEAAVLLGVERHTIWRWVKEGKLEAQRAGASVFLEREVVKSLKEK